MEHKYNMNKGRFLAKKFLKNIKNNDYTSRIRGVLHISLKWREDRTKEGQEESGKYRGDELDHFYPPRFIHEIDQLSGSLCMIGLEFIPRTRD